jgi:tRNA U34 5-carboxymethylaminomethyl modifying GTPase MnmE/TrmE
MMDAADTIAAISTPLGEGGIGVVRVSGPAAIGVAAALFRSAVRSLGAGLETFASHTAHYGQVVEPGSGEMIDECVLTLFRGPHSYTGRERRSDALPSAQTGGWPTATRCRLAQSLSRVALP